MPDLNRSYHPRREIRERIGGMPDLSRSYHPRREIRERTANHQKTRKSTTNTTTYHSANNLTPTHIAR